MLFGFLFVVAGVFTVTEARECVYTFTRATCNEQCCGKDDGSMRCLHSCENVTCSSDEDCGTSCCKKGMCGPPGADCGNTLAIIIAVVISVVVIAIIVAVTVVIVICCRRRRAHPGMIVLVNQ